MRYTNHNTVEDLKIAYIGGGSQGWAWGLMSDLAASGDLSGQVALYDIDYKAAKQNAIIGNRYNELPDCKSHWDYSAVETLQEALTGADFVVISILPGTFDEMESDVHTPEKYGIYQSVGDTTGPGGIIRALRSIPQFEVIAHGIRDYCPKAWVINYTNPMALCVKALYDAFPEIRAFGCCHEVFGGKKLLASAVKDICGVDGITRDDVKINVVGVNHFTWVTNATWHNMDLMPVYGEFARKYYEKGFEGQEEINWMNSSFATNRRVKFDLFLRYGYFANAGDRHLAEFCPKNWYLANEKYAHSWGFGLTSVEWRKRRQQGKLERGLKLVSGEEAVSIKPTEEEGVLQMRALLGLSELITNVNLPNMGQIPNMPLGAIVETNAIFRDGMLNPVYSGNVPSEITGLVNRIADEQLLVAEAGRTRDLNKAFLAFVNDPLVDLPLPQAKALFDEMINNTKQYLGEYFA